jgi:adenylate kinase
MALQTRKQNTPTVPTVLILGPQGSGKGTQAERLAQKYHLIHIEMGAILRGMSRRKRQTAFTKKVTQTINAGFLVPSSWVIRLIDERLDSIPPTRGIVLDGSARRLPEARSLFKILRKHRRELTHVFLISISRSESFKRLTRRWLCKRNRHILIMGKHVRSPHDRCPVCGSTILQREDETPPAIRKRLAQFQRETAPVVSYYRRCGLLRAINGEQTISRVFRDVDGEFRRLNR